MNSFPTKKKGSKNPNVKEFKCNQCGETFGSNATLREHIQGIIPEKLCAKIMMKPFGKIWKLEKHAETTKFKCDDCGKEFLIQ